MRHQEKLISLQEAAEIVQAKQHSKMSVGLCHGCFDILHVGHLRHFVSAREQSDFLIVSVTPDQYINKGPNRPVFPADQRAELIAGLETVDAVIINKWDTAVPLLQLLKPDIFFKGQEYEIDPTKVNPAFLIEAEMMNSLGGSVLFTREWTSSSSAAIKRMQSV